MTARYPYQPVTARRSGGRARHFVVQLAVPQDPRRLLPRAPGRGERQRPRRPRTRAGHRRLAAGVRDRLLERHRARACIRLFPTSSAGGTILDQNGAEVAHIDCRPGQARVLHRPVQRPAVHHDRRERQHRRSRSATPRAASVDVHGRVDERDHLPRHQGQLQRRRSRARCPTPARSRTSRRPTHDQGQPRRHGAGTVGPVLVDGQTVKTKVIKSSKKAKKKALHKIRTARVVKPFDGKRVAAGAGQRQERHGGPQDHHQARQDDAHVYKRFVLANKKVAVKNLPIPAKTAKVTVSLIG